MAALSLPIILQVAFAYELNISFETSPLHLPEPLYQHILATNGNYSLHVLAGETTTNNTTTSSYIAYSTSLFNVSQFVNHSESVSFSVDPFNVPDLWQAPNVEPTTAPTASPFHFELPLPVLLPTVYSGNCVYDSEINFFDYSLSCDNKCSQSINDSLYIVQSIRSKINTQSCISLYLIIYDLDKQQYRSSSTYNYYYFDVKAWEDVVRYPYYIICVYSAFGGIIVVGSDTAELIQSYYYYIPDDTWYTDFSRAFSILRKAGQCVIYDDYMYLFGGIYGSGENALESRYGEKCSISSSTACSYLTTNMAHYRSNFHITLIMDQYFLIYGGTTEEAQRSMELFDPTTDEFITEIEYNTASLTTYGSAALMIDNYLIVTGGKNADGAFSNNIQYIDVFSLFPQEEDDDDEDIRLCVTTYITNDGCVYIDDYLLSMSEHIFDVHSDSFSLVINPANLLFEFSLNFFKTGTNHSVHYTQTMDSANIMQNFDLTNIMKNTDVNPAVGYYVFWLRYTPYLEWGFGDVFEEWPRFGPLIPATNTLFIADITSFKVCDGRWGFYSNACEMNMNLDTDTFKVNGYIKFNWKLIEATSIKLAIYITSDDIIGVNHTMYITDNDYNVSVCTFCTGISNTSCVACATGIQVMDLIHYDINNNSYSVSIYSDYPQIVATKTFILTRSVQTVHFMIEVASESDDDNITAGLYPNAEIYITPIYDKNTTFQPFGTFEIQFDEQLTMKDNVGEIMIDFYEDSCVLLYNSKSIDCYTEPVIVPLSMISASIDNLLYSIEITSFDTEITGDALFSIPRSVQTVSIEFSDDLYLGQVLDVLPLVSDKEVYQNISTISVSNAEYGIYSEITIEFDHNYKESVVIKHCVIETPLRGTIEPCDEGITLKISKASALEQYIYLNLSSSDTYLEEYIKKVFITQCPLGFGLKGNDKSSWLCSACEENTVNIHSNSKCVSCDTQFAKGAKCKGSNEISITYNYWLDFNDANSESIIAAFCPAGYCCQNIDGCNYLQNLNRSNAANELCAANRDPAVPLCGACLAGYTEVFGSAACKKCQADKYSYLIVPFISSILFVLLLLLLDQPPSKRVDPLLQNTQEDAILISPFIKDDLKSLKVCLFRPLLYYYQAVNYVTMQTGLWFYLAPLARVLSLDLFDSSINNQEAGICFLNDMQSIDKQLWFLFVPTSMFIAVAIFAVFNAWIKYQFKKYIRFLNFGWNVVWTIFILLIGNIVSTMLKILACAKVNDEFKHFYDGSKACFGVLWMVALAFISVIILIWIFVWVLLYRMEAKKRDSRNSYLRSVTQSYKVEYWFWEILLVSRRILLSFMVTIQYMSYDITQYSLLIILTIYFGLHYRYYPFNYNRANVIESLCLFLLITTLATVIFEFHVKYPAFVSIMMSIMVALPILWLLAYVLLLSKQIFIYKKYKEGATKMGIESLSQINKRKYEARKEKWAKRLTQSQRELFGIDVDEEIQESDPQLKEDVYKQTEKGHNTKGEKTYTDNSDEEDKAVAVDVIEVSPYNIRYGDGGRQSSSISTPSVSITADEEIQESEPQIKEHELHDTKVEIKSTDNNDEAGVELSPYSPLTEKVKAGTEPKESGIKKSGTRIKSSKTKRKKKALPADTKGAKKKGSKKKKSKKKEIKKKEIKKNESKKKESKKKGSKKKNAKRHISDDAGSKDKRTHLVDDDK